MRIQRPLACSLVAAGAGLLAASPAVAAVINVPGDQPTIQAGIDAAVNGDEVVVATGNYTENVILVGKAITVRSVDPDDPTTVAQTVIDGGGAGTTFLLQNVGDDTRLLGFVITGGSSAASGGGLRLSNADAVVRNCTIANNTAQFGGGAAIAAGSPLFVNCAFIANNATGGGGGLDTTNGTTARFENCQFLSNTAAGNGGAAQVRESVTFADCAFSANQAASGGGAFCSNNPSTFERCTFTCNTSGNAGGGIHVLNAPNVAITDCRFVANTASNIGGGVHTQAAGTTINGSTFHANSATNGGGIGGQSYLLADTGLCQNVPDNAPGPFADGGGNSLQVCAPPVQACVPPVQTCPTDLNESGATDFADILEVISNWGPCP